MGAWGTGLYSNDITLDIRDDYRQFLEDGTDGENLINRMKEKYSELFDTEEEYLFWIALADISFKYGRMTDEIKDKAINWIDIITETETDDEDSKRWNKTLIKLKAKLLKPEPEKKIIRQKKPLLTNPWNVGDCYAYKLHGKYAKGNGYYGKYIVFLKTGEIVTHKNNEEITYNIIMKFDEIFDDLPDVSMLKGIRPLTYLPVEYLHGGENGISYPEDVTENEFSEFRKDIMETFGWGFLRWWCIFESKHCSERFFKYLGKMDDISDYANYELRGPFSNPVDEERRMIEIHNGWKGIEY